MTLGAYCLDVGQGQCIALIVPAPDGFQAALIDVGVNGYRLAGWLRRIGVRRVPLVVLTHNHEDHLRGLASLVEAFSGFIGDVRFVIDQPPEEIPFWLPFQEWRDARRIGSIGVVYPPDTSEPGVGLRLLHPGLDGFQLFCIYPTVFEAQAVAQGAPLLGPLLGRSPNAASAILRLARVGEPETTIALFGGDLTFRGWSRLVERGHDLSAEVLVVPHHGSNSGADQTFGPGHLAREVRPRFALISVGTHNRYGHPRMEVVRAFRDVGTTVLCTQITNRCCEAPELLPGRTVRAADPAEPDLVSTGVRCAGTIMIVVPEGSHPEVIRLAEHQDGVDGLRRSNERPMCRP